MPMQHLECKRNRSHANRIMGSVVCEHRGGTWGIQSTEYQPASKRSDRWRKIPISRMVRRSTRGNNELEIFWQRGQMDHGDLHFVGGLYGHRRRFVARPVPLHPRHNARLALPTLAISPSSRLRGAMSDCRSTASWICLALSPARTLPTSAPGRVGSRCVLLAASRTRARFMPWTSTPRQFATSISARKKSNSRI